MTSYVLKEKCICGFGNTENKKKKRKKKADTETKHYCWFRHSPGIFSSRESRPHHQFLEGYPALKPLWKRVEVTAWHHLLGQGAEESSGCSSICCWTSPCWCMLNVLESGCQTELLQGSAEEGLDNLANWISAELLITVRRLEQITTGKLGSSSHPQGWQQLGESLHDDSFGCQYLYSSCHLGCPSPS